MKKVILAGIFILSVVSFFSCDPPSSGSQSSTSTPDPAHNSQNSLDWDGVYRGVLPCADCQGIQTTLTLSKSLDYRLRLKYLGKSDSTKEYTGKFSWNPEGNTITLDVQNMPNKYFVGENVLTQLDLNGNKITGDLANNYILSKANYAIIEKYWKLTELNGKPVAVDSTYVKEPHIILKDADNRFNGNGGCNSISGNYEVGPMNSIKFSKAIVTQMACPRLDIEAQFLKVLETADNFTINGDMLVLNKARMAPLARFKTVYMK